MNTHTLTQLRDELGNVVRRIEHSHQEVVITDSGREAAVIISMEDYRMIKDQLSAARRERILAEARAAGLTVTDEGRIVFDDRAVAEVERRWTEQEAQSA